VPEQAQYRLLLTTEGRGQDGLVPKVVRGTLRLDSKPASIIGRLWKQMFAKVVQESSF